MSALTSFGIRDMTTPNLSRVVETFVPCCDSREAVRLWEAYFCFLRRTVSPIVRQLQRDAMVGWFSFLVHDCASGVPCPPEDTRFFIHLRLELLAKAGSQIWIFHQRASTLASCRQSTSDPSGRHMYQLWLSLLCLM